MTSFMIDTCRIFHIPPHIINLREPNDRIRQVPSDALRHGLEYLITNKIQPILGDLIVFDSIAFYGNLGVTIFDGDHLLNLEENKFGSNLIVPKEIRDQFPLDYWSLINGNFPDISVDYHGCTYLYYQVDQYGLEGSSFI